MNISSKNALWLLVIAAFCYVVFHGLPVGLDGTVNVTVNGREIEGLPKAVFAAIGIIGAAISSLVAFVFITVVLIGTSLLVLAVLACLALALLGAAFPLLLPVIVPLAVVFAVIVALRQSHQRRLT
jgi:hypothetical protein